MAKLSEWIMECAQGEPVEGVVIGEMGCGGDHSDKPRGRLMTWEEALPHLVYDFDDDYGAGPYCEAITAWTKSWVIAVSQRDGSTTPFALPRHPVAHTPIMPGGS